ncbi:hypothetical protein BDF21DRAFT_450906 [Thamnidium elegans]|nr:hypothetical protein BDF21DRAFT_450906 [Thamnidium elegans]
MADQYSNYSLLGENNQRLFINGNLTLGENMADSGGITLVLNTYQKITKKLCNEKFFCDSSCLDVKKSEGANVHSSSYHRAIIPFQNSREFSEAFNCPLRSPMDPEDKCSVWLFRYPLCYF